MNKIYRIVWNQVTATWVAVAEIGNSHGKRSGTVGRVDRAALLSLPPLKALVASLMLIGAVAPMPAWAQVAANQLPTGGNVVGGTASITATNTPGAVVLNINQTTARAAVDWATFNVGSAAQVNFNQPSSSSVTLNRVLDSNPSQIFGRITAPGQVFLVNPNGVFFAPGASVDVGGLVATTHRMGVADFMAGRTTFERNGATGSVVNQGELNAALGGYIALLAPEVRNEGVIIAQAGTVALASGEAISLNFSDNGTLAGITATQSQIAALVENKNAVLAPGGLIILSAMAASSLQGGVIKHSGTLSASSLTEKGGRILLEGDHISLTGSSQTTAAGASGGGEVLVGGDWQGGANTTYRVFDDPNAMKQATTVTMAAGASIDVSATQNGDGGTAVLWSDVSKSESVTTAAGTILAKGGSESGNGGFIETSGARLDIADSVHIDTQAPTGTTGQWLLDPVDITIAASGGNVTGSAITTALQTTNVTLDTAGAGTCTSVTCTTLTGTAGDIHVNDTITWSGRTLTLNADKNINVNAVLDASGGGNLTLLHSRTTAGKLTMRRNDATNSFTGKVNLNSGSVVNINGLGYTVLSASNIANATALTNLQGTANLRYVLGADIDATTTNTWNAGAGFSPIQFGSTFTGKFEGLGHTVDSLFIARNAENSIGLFGFTFTNAYIGNIGVKNANITGGLYVGGLAGQTRSSTIHNSFSTGSVTGTNALGYAGGLIGSQASTLTTLSDSYSSAAVTGTDYVGGLVGTAGLMNITNSFSTGSVTASGSNAGGLLGALSQSTLSNSYSTASVTGNGASKSNFGGLVGRVQNTTTISGSYATGPVTTTDAGSFAVGGLTGTLEDSTLATSFSTGTVNSAGYRVGGLIGSASGATTTITNAYSRSNVTGLHSKGGLIGQLSNATVTKTYSTGTISAGGADRNGHTGKYISGTITNSFWDVDSSGIGTSGDSNSGATGRTTAEMKTLATFTGASWDFAGETANGTSDIWRLKSSINNGYACLSGLNSCDAIVAYLRLITGSSVFGNTPNLTYGLYDASANGTAISDASPTGTVTWSTLLSNTSAAATYSLTYVSGITLGSTAYSLQAGAAVNWTINPTATTTTTSTSPVIVPPVVNVAPSGSSGTSSDVSVGQVGVNGISISIDQDSTSGLDQSETRTVMLTVSLPSEMATAGNGFSFELPASVQALIGNDLPMIGLSDGSPLPAWIRFNPATMRFDAQAVPDGAFPLQVLISTSKVTVLIAISERKE